MLFLSTAGLQILLWAKHILLHPSLSNFPRVEYGSSLKNFLCEKKKNNNNKNGKAFFLSLFSSSSH